MSTAELKRKLISEILTVWDSRQDPKKLNETIG